MTINEIVDRAKQLRGIKAGDRIKVKIPTRSGWIKGWRKVRKVEGGRIEILAHGWNDFHVAPHEILGVMPCEK